MTVPGDAAGEVARRRGIGMMWTLALRRFRTHLQGVDQPTGATTTSTPTAPTPTDEDTDGRAR